MTAPNPWIEARALLRRAPAKVRRTLAVNVGAAAVGEALAIIDVLTGTSEHEVYRLLGVALAMIGLVLLSQVYILHHLSQHEDPTCQPSMSFFRLQSQRLHVVLLGLPLLGMGAALAFAAAMGLFVPSVADRPFLLVVIAVLAFYLWLAARSVRHTTAFLYEHAREQAAQAANARAEATEAQLRALQAQMQPHFLFNALNTVAALVRTDARAAERTVENLAQVLRKGLERSRRGGGTVREEVDFVRAWLAVEQQRWGDRLRVTWDLDPAALDLPLPPLTLQPLVENALKHGLGGRIAGGQIGVRIAREPDGLHVTVTDDGEGLAGVVTDGTGLGNLKQRLRARFGEAARVTLARTNQHTTTHIHMPIPESG